MTTTCTSTGPEVYRQTGRASSSQPKTAISPQRGMRTFVKILLVGAAAAMVVQALLIHIENRSTNDGRCTFFATPQNAPSISLQFDEPARHTHGLPILRVPTGADWIATVCGHGLNDRNFGTQIH
jgi:hypothetical protein